MDVMISKIKVDISDKPIYLKVKRATDISLSLIMLLLFLPLILVFYFLVKIESKGEFIYKQERLGVNGKKFTLYKIRTMYINAEDNGIRLADENDERITKVGKFLRRYKLDEIPQFFNILKGDMTLVGPRPERPYFYKKFSREIPEFIERIIVKPGLTGYAQINGDYDMNPKDKLMFDLYYIKNRSIILDLKIILKTFPVILKGKGFR